MVSPGLLVEARRRAGLSQRGLAARAGVGRQQIAPCELELTFGLARADASYDEAIARMLALSPAQRLARGLRDAESVRAVGAQAHHESAPPDAIGVLRTLEAAGLHYVLIGELAEVLHGSPLLPMSATVTIVPRSGEGQALRDALTAGRGHDVSGSPKSLLHAAERWRPDTFCAELEIVPAPPGTHGYEDLRRDATRLQIDADEVSVTVASLVDLVRIGEASNDRARMPALRHTLELGAPAASTGNARAA